MVGIAGQLSHPALAIVGLVSLAITEPTPLTEEPFGAGPGDRLLVPFGGLRGCRLIGEICEGSVASGDTSMAAGTPLLDTPFIAERVNLKHAIGICPAPDWKPIGLIDRPTAARTGLRPDGANPL